MAAAVLIPKKRASGFFTSAVIMAPSSVGSRSAQDQTSSPIITH
jgi:hypothetical protein